jgi:anti-sigma regulatory factor (Ser/Thr protein kinase)
MGLDSSLKSSPDGFARYYEARARALENLEGFVRFEMQSAGDDHGGTLTVRVKDSGAGFDYPSDIESWRNPRSGPRTYHGRGLVLLGELCESVRYSDPGNEVEVVFRWKTQT